MNALDNTITQDELKRLFYYNPETGSLIRLVTLQYNARKGDIAGYEDKSRGTNYLTVNVKGRAYYLHRLIWLYVTNEWPNQVDHIDHDGLNNRWKNLRNVTHQENHKNLPKRKTNTSGITGVSWYKSRSKWEAYIMVEYKNKRLGYFYDFFEACCIRKSAENRLNFHENHGSERI